MKTEVSPPVGMIKESNNGVDFSACNSPCPEITVLRSSRTIFSDEFLFPEFLEWLFYHIYVYNQLNVEIIGQQVLSISCL